MAQLFQSGIARILPHRYPFLLVDTVSEFVPGERITAIKRFSANDAVLQGGPGGVAVVPSAILIEAVTQLGAILVLERPQMAGKVAMVLQIPYARATSPVFAGDTLRLEAHVLRLGETFGELRGVAYRGEELVAEGQVRFAIASAAEVRAP